MSFFLVKCLDIPSAVHADSLSVGHMVSAALMCLDYMHMGIAHALREIMLLTSFMIKLSFIVIELSLIIAFRVTEHTHYNENNMAATLEWSMPLNLSLLSSRSFRSIVTNCYSHRLSLHGIHSLLDSRPPTIRPTNDPRTTSIPPARNEHGLIDFLFYIYIALF